MSEYLSSVAAALGAPEELVSRSAAARAAADGTSADDVLAAWSGGAPLPEASTPPTPTAVVDASPVNTGPDPVTPEVAPATATAVVTAAAAPAAVAIPDPTSTATPVLEGQRGRPFVALAGIIALFVVGLVVTLWIPASTGGDYTHLVPDAELSATGEAGLDVYLREGCWYCHTQLIRPVLADVGLGPVTETFSDPLDSAAFGIQRIGPDLAHIGSRLSLTGDDTALTRTDLEALFSDPQSVYPEGRHPSYTYLDDADLAALTTYLLELK